MLISNIFILSSSPIRVTYPSSVDDPDKRMSIINGATDSLALEMTLYYPDDMTTSNDQIPPEFTLHVYFVARYHYLNATHLTIQLMPKNHTGSAYVNSLSITLRIGVAKGKVDDRSTWNDQQIIIELFFENLNFDASTSKNVTVPIRDWYFVSYDVMVNYNQCYSPGGGECTARSVSDFKKDGMSTILVKYIEGQVTKEDRNRALGQIIASTVFILGYFFISVLGYYIALTMVLSTDRMELSLVSLGNYLLVLVAYVLSLVFFLFIIDPWNMFS